MLKVTVDCSRLKDTLFSETKWLNELLGRKGNLLEHWLIPTCTAPYKTEEKCLLDAQGAVFLNDFDPNYPHTRAFFSIAP